MTCATPLCSPSRANFLTGLYAHTHRVMNNDKIGLTEISHTLMTWPRLLRESGYETAFVGKWHMGLDDSRRPGFHHWVSFKGQGVYIDPVVNYNGESRQLRGYMTDYLNQEAVSFVRRKHSRPFGELPASMRSRSGVTPPWASQGPVGSHGSSTASTPTDSP